MAGCSTPPAPNVAVGARSYEVAPPLGENSMPAHATISAGDEVSLMVVGEPDLSAAKLVVDDAGRLEIPLLGSVMVGGLSPDQASRLLERKLGERYLRDPHVALNVTVAAEKLVSVEGQVNHAGSYPVEGNTTLLGALAMAQSPTRIAKLNETMLFRTVSGQRMVARFDIKRIRAGIDPDPQILAGDVVVVGFAPAKAVYRDVLLAAPILNIFTRF
ncbi:polysaccharide biosynthesis/export family protein [Novosphingobium pituita]|nr:polysaccharide biosynthesis/export family protein [Novosphingobium sp. IK01]